MKVSRLTFGLISLLAELPSAPAWILDRDSLIRETGISEPSWYLGHEPFIDLPVGDDDSARQIQEVYYYRWSVIHRQHHYDRFKSYEYLGGYLGLTGNGGGAGQWLDERWMRGIDWPIQQFNAHFLSTEGRYSDANAHNFYQWAMTTGNMQILKDNIWDLVEHIDAWRGAYYDEEVGLYWHQPVWDATEHTLASAQTPFAVPSDVDFQPAEAFLVPGYSFFGGYGYTVLFNTYIAADAKIIAKVLGDMDQPDQAARFDKLFKDLMRRMEEVNWDPERKFYYHVMKDNYYQNYSDANGDVHPDLTRLDGKEIFGYIPWQFGLPPDDSDHASVWNHLNDSETFGSDYGPSTAELDNPHVLTPNYYDPELFDGNCCRWSGPNWPFSTAKTCIALATFLNEYNETGGITKDDYYRLLSKFAKIQYKDGRPYVAEAHDPRNETWIYDEPAYSNHYYHYPYNTVVLTDLIGIRSQEDDMLVVNPLVPDSWDWFGAEFPYKGKDYTVTWDRDGSHYGHGAGLSILDSNDNVLKNCGSIQRLSVSVESCPSGYVTPQRANYAANGARIGSVFGGDPYPFPWGYGSYGGATHGDKYGTDERWDLSFTDNPSRRGEAPQNAFDGQILYDHDLWYARWTNVGSGNSQDWLAVDLGVGRTIDTVNVYTWVNGTTKIPRSITLQYISPQDSPYNASASADPSTLKWTDVPGVKYPDTFWANDVNGLAFPALEVQNLRILFGAGDVVGITEIEAWGDYDDSVVNCPTQTTNPNAQHYEAEQAVIFQGSTLGSPYACDWGVVGGLNAYGNDYFVNDFSVVTRGDFNATTTGEQRQGYTGDSYIEWYVNVASGGQQNMTVRYANGGNETTRMPLAVDGNQVDVMDLPTTGNFSLVEGGLQLTSKVVEVPAGRHRIRLTKGEVGFAEFDYMELEPMS